MRAPLVAVLVTLAALVAAVLADQHVVVVLNQITRAAAKQQTTTTESPATSTTKKQWKNTGTKKVSMAKRSGPASSTTATVAADLPQIGSIHVILSNTAPPAQGLPTAAPEGVEMRALKGAAGATAPPGASGGIGNLSAATLAEMFKGAAMPASASSGGSSFQSSLMKVAQSLAGQAGLGGAQGSGQGGTPVTAQAPGGSTLPPAAGGAGGAGGAAGAGGLEGTVKRALAFSSSGQQSGPLHKETVHSVQREILHLGTAPQISPVAPPAPVAPAAPGAQTPMLLAVPGRQGLIQSGPNEPLSAAVQMAVLLPGMSGMSGLPGQPAPLQTPPAASVPAASVPTPLPVPGSLPSLQTGNTQQRTLHGGTHTIELNITHVEGGAPQVSSRHVSHSP